MSQAGVLTSCRSTFDPFLALRHFASTNMPSYYPSRPVGGQLPLTPPDSGSGYAFRSIHYPHEPYASHAGRHDNSYDYQSSYMQSQVGTVSSGYPYQQSNYSCNSLPPIQSSYYEPTAAPTLPPLRITDRANDDYHRSMPSEQSSSASRNQPRQAQAQAPAPKEEKATGGVSAKLDYEMERMTDFVTEAAQSMYALHLSPICIADIDVTRSFQHQMQSHPSFRKWVHQVLSATRLPSATILLSLHYLNDRLAKHPGSVQPGENQIYRLLAVALILGSKFLDDNTFINRSWSDVTAIKVMELNMLEMKWLGLIQYRLHIDPKCLQAWIDSWQKYDSEYAAKHQPTRLSPLDTNVHRHTRQAERYSPYPTPQTASSHTFESSSRSMGYPTPYSATDPWTASSDRHDYYKSQHRFQTYDLHEDNSSRYHSYDPISEAARRASEEHARQVAYAYPQSAHPSYYPGLSSYGNAWDQRGWSSSTAHRYDCTCSTCSYQSHYRSYAMGSGYNAAQPVMG